MLGKFKLEATTKAAKTATTMLEQSMMRNRLEDPTRSDLIKWWYKVGHSRRTARVARTLGPMLGGRTGELLEIAAILHDAGRFPQVKRYGTFNDAESADHGALSADVTLAGRERLLENGLTEQEFLELHDAVLRHNKLALPGDGVLVHALRDCDRIEIAASVPRIMTTKDKAAFFIGIPETEFEWPAHPSDSFLAAYMDGRVPSRLDMEKRTDELLNVFTWTTGNLALEQSRKLCAQARLSTRMLTVFDRTWHGYETVARLAEGR